MKNKQQETTTKFQWETPNPIEAFQDILGTMQSVEQNFFQAKKTEDELNARQNDLLHALELDLDDDELDRVQKALRDIRIQRRDIKDTLVNLKDAQEFIIDNYKFMGQLSDMIHKMETTTNKVKNRKYFMRDCEAMKEVINMEKHSDIVHAYIPLEERIAKQENSLEALANKFNK